MRKLLSIIACVMFSICMNAQQNVKYTQKDINGVWLFSEVYNEKEGCWTDAKEIDHKVWGFTDIISDIYYVSIIAGENVSTLKLYYHIIDNTITVYNPTNTDDIVFRFAIEHITPKKEIVCRLSIGGKNISNKVKFKFITDAF